MIEKKLIELDYVRGISCLLIILYHYTTRYTEVLKISDFPIRITWGCGAVNNFFLLTGFLTALKLQEDATLFQFLKKRAIRLYPTYWLSVLSTSIITMLLCPQLHKNIYITLMNLPMIHGFLGIESVDGVYWTLFFELIFYFYICVIILIKKEKNIKLLFLSIFWTLISIVLIILELKLKKNIFIRLLDLVFMPDMCAPFVVGISLYLLYALSNYILPFSLILLSLFLSYISQPISYFMTLLITTFLMLVIIFVNKSKYKYFYISLIIKTKNVLKPIAFMSLISYPLYLLHQFIGYSILYKLNIYNFKNEIWIILPFLFTIILSMIYLNLSTKMQNYLNKIIK